MSVAPYPLRVTASLDPHLNRGLWLVKWLLAIPHYVVLAVLWLCFSVLSIVAFFAILLTGHYPRPIFDFNVGVLRWSWRVAYYSYGALGTDHYPPFTLDDVPDYPAHLDVAYPEHLSRGLVLVKWWLLALPQYLVVAIFAGGGLYVADQTAGGNGSWSWRGGGLIDLLVLVAGIVLLFSGSYPRPLFDLILGLNRWVLRVAAYAALMTDRYPPFRLDMGGDEPGQGNLVMDQPPSPGAPAAPLPPDSPAPLPPDRPGPGQSGRWGAGRVVALVAGVLVALIAGALLLTGAVLGLAGHALRDAEGYYTTPGQTLTSPGRALASETISVPRSTAGWSPSSVLGRLKVEVRPTGGQAVFVGIGRAPDVARYLSGVRYSVVTSVGGQHARYVQVPGSRIPRPPASAGIWVASTQGPGTQHLTWPAQPGHWQMVMMAANTTAPVTVRTAVGTTFPALGRVVTLTLMVGAVLLVGAVVLIVVALRSRAEPPGTSSPAEQPPPAPPAASEGGSDEVAGRL